MDKRVDQTDAINGFRLRVLVIFFFTIGSGGFPFYIRFKKSYRLILFDLREPKLKQRLKQTCHKLKRKPTNISVMVR